MYFMHSKLPVLNCWYMGKIEWTTESTYLKLQVFSIVIIPCEYLAICAISIAAAYPSVET